ncbi:hypothetical protein TL16_g05851 [Triparma laevis f. inornata]|uniref:Uncharacterized protein n=1 Tax=Triparma laevis f. inornata TaxID=1714386 RepID=A0A9W7EB40_9STRA|nr:hypothetical protein TL16_g05851 [Triparma laevis f. inornata]
MSSFTSPPNPQSLSSALNTAIATIETDAIAATVLLSSVASKVASLSLFSEGEDLTDVSTESIRFLLLPFYLAKAKTNVPEINPTLRLGNISNAESLYIIWLSKALDMGGGEGGDEGIISQEDVGVVKSRFKEQKEAEQAMETIKARLDRRKRLGVETGDVFEGSDEETLLRDLYIKEMKRAAVEAIEDLGSFGRELEMLKMQAEFEKRRAAGDHPPTPHPGSDGRAPPPHSKMETTTITKSNINEFVFKAQQLKSGVFRPGWNLPTMSLEELGEIEYRDAMERAEQQKVSATSRRVNQN